jgi:GT2 family glycosyltransferase
VHVLLPVHNRHEITKRCIEQLLAQTYRPINLIVIDDGSTDATAEMVAETAPAATVLRGNGKLWWAGSLQWGLDYVAASSAPTGDLVLFLNDDTAFDPCFIENGVAAMQKTSDSMLLAQAYSLQSGEFIELGTRVDWAKLQFESVSNIDEVNCLSTRGLFIRLGNALRVGGFRPLLLPHYLSDYEFTIRALRKGIAAVTHRSVKLYLNERTTGQRVPDKGSAGAYLRSVMTKRSALNPLHWSAFLLLACPARYLMLNLWRVWISLVYELLHANSRRHAPPM